MSPLTVLSVGWRGDLCAFIGGAIAPLALAPYGFWPAGILSLLLLMYVLQSCSPTRGIWRGWLYGLGSFGAGSSWVYVSIHLYGNASTYFAGFLTLVFVAGLALILSASFGYLYSRWFRPAGALKMLAFPSLWVAFEWFRSWFLTGFPWLYAGYGHTDTWLASWAPVGGVYLLSFFIALSAALIYLLTGLVRDNNYLKCIPLAIGLILPWITGLAISGYQWTQEKGTAQEVVLLQPNVPQDIKWQPEQRHKTLALLQLSVSAAKPQELLVWPENAIPAFFHQAQRFTNAISDQAKSKQVGIVSGVPFLNQQNIEGEPIYHNSIAGFGSASGIYHKQKLVPFGEYVPLESLLRGLIAFFDLPMSNFRPGPAQQLPLEFQNDGQVLKIATYICYEMVYPDFVRSLASRSDAIITISDDSWFGSSIGPDQHLQMARMRALEVGRYVLRATNTGLTAIIGPTGRVLAQARQFEQTSLRGSIYSVSGETPFGVWGSWPILAFCLFGLTTVLIKQRMQLNNAAGII